MLANIDCLDRVELEKKKEKFKEYIVTPRKDIKEVLTYLRSKVDISLSRRDKEEHFKKIIKTNAYHFRSHKNVDKKDMRVEVFRIHANRKSELYYTTTDDNEIYLAVEYNSGYFETNSHHLLLELFVIRGINEEDVEGNNDVFKDYLMHLEKYMNKEY